MIIECPHCESRVDGQAVGEVIDHDPDFGLTVKTVLLKCPLCDRPLLGDAEQIQTGHDEWGWSDLTRLWPDPDGEPHFDIPAIARNSLIEAQLCFKATAYSACVVMAGRAIEGVCQFHASAKSTKANLAAGLKELKTKGLIDERIYKWGEELRKHRNLGAHASDVKVLREDAADLLDFASAICEYVFVLHAKFERFEQRAAKRAKRK